MTTESYFDSYLNAIEHNLALGRWIPKHLIDSCASRLPESERERFRVECQILQDRYPDSKQPDVTEDELMLRYASGTMTEDGVMAYLNLNRLEFRERFHAWCIAHPEEATRHGYTKSWLQ